MAALTVTRRVLYSRLIMDPALVQLIANVGFPIAVAAWLLVEMPKLRRSLDELAVKIDRLISLQEYQVGLRKREDV